MRCSHPPYLNTFLLILSFPILRSIPIPKSNLNNIMKIQVLAIFACLLIFQIYLLQLGCTTTKSIKTSTPPNEDTKIYSRRLLSKSVAIDQRSLRKPITRVGKSDHYNQSLRRKPRSGPNPTQNK